MSNIQESDSVNKEGPSSKKGPAAYTDPDNKFGKHLNDMLEEHLDDFPSASEETVYDPSKVHTQTAAEIGKHSEISRESAEVSRLRASGNEAEIARRGL